MKRSEENPEAGGPCYTLYLEHLGGLVPILKGRRISKLRPEFVIMDPKMDGKAGTSICTIADHVHLKVPILCLFIFFGVCWNTFS